MLNTIVSNKFLPKLKLFSSHMGGVFPEIKLNDLDKFNDVRRLEAITSLDIWNQHLEFINDKIHQTRRREIHSLKS